MKTFKMRWPELKIDVICEAIEENEKALDVFLANIPVKAIQGHDVIGGWILRDRAVHLKKKSFDIPKEELKTEKLCEAPEGRISLLFPSGSSTEVLVKYGDCVDDRDYVPVANVRKEDLEALKKAGKAVWRSATRSKEVYVVEFMEVK